MKIAILTKYGDLAASTRQRFNQYQPFLEEVGFEIIKVPLFNNNYLYNFFNNNQRNLGYVVKSYINRFLWVVSKPKVDLIWLHCDLFPYMPGFFEKFLTYTKKPIVYDLDDAIFHNYDLSSKWYVRKLLGRKLHDTISLAQLSLCGNQYLAKYAKTISSRVEIVPTVVNTDILTPSETIQSKDLKLKIGWIGSPTTWSQYLLPKVDILKDLITKAGGQVNIMGAKQKDIDKNSPFKFFEWSEKNEIIFLQSLDVGIMPLTNSPWASGKCGYKLIQYMSCGLPVVASPVGVNKEIVEHGVNGFLADTNEDWQKYLEKLMNDSDLRKRMGDAGRKKVEEQFSLKVWGPKVSHLVYSALNNKDT